MKVSEISAPQVHDLLQIDAHALTADSVSRPQWVTETLICCPWVVVRRSQAPAGQISVGVRGAARSERWAGCCSETLIKKIVRPAELLVPSRTSAHLRRPPALRAVQEVIERWQGLSLPWGPSDLSSQPDTQSRQRRAISILLSARPTGLILSGHCFYGIVWLDCRSKWTFEWRLRCAVSRSTNTLTHHQREYCCGTQTGCGLAMILGC